MISQTIQELFIALTNKQTNRQTDTHTIATENITTSLRCRITFFVDAGELYASFNHVLKTVSLNTTLLLCIVVCEVCCR